MSSIMAEEDSRRVRSIRFMMREGVAVVVAVAGRYAWRRENNNVKVDEVGDVVVGDNCC